MNRLARMAIVLIVLVSASAVAQPPVANSGTPADENKAPSQSGATAAVYVTDAQIQEILQSAPHMDRAARVIDAGHFKVGVFVIHRLADADEGCTIEHDTMTLDSTTEVWRILDGAGTLVTGGTLMHPKPMVSDDPDLPLLGHGVRGSPISGGESRRIAKGDVVIVPAGVPHGFSSIEGSITMLVVRIDPAKILPTK